MIGIKKYPCFKKSCKITHLLSLLFVAALLLAVFGGCNTRTQAQSDSGVSSDSFSAVVSSANSVAETTTSADNVTDASAQSQTETTEAQENIDVMNSIKPSLLLKTTGCTYSYTEDSKTNILTLTFSYENGKTQADFPSEWVPKIAPYECIPCCLCVSPNKTAVACIQNNTVVIVFSDDKGKTWNVSSPIAASQIPVHKEGHEGEHMNPDKDAGNFLIDFASQDCGYLLICGGLTGGSEYEHDLFKTTDGGKTWNYIPSNLPVQSNYVTDMHFTDSKTGYMSVSCSAAFLTEIWKTADGGKTWSGTVPPLASDSDTLKKYQFDGAFAFAPYFINSKGYLLAYSRDTVENMFIYCVSTDNGKTWKYDTTKYNLTSDFAYTDK